MGVYVIVYRVRNQTKITTRSKSIGMHNYYNKKKKIRQCASRSSLSFCRVVFRENYLHDSRVQSRAMPPPRLFGRHLTVTYFYVDYYTTTTKNYVQPYVEPLSSIAPPFRRRLIIPIRNHHPCIIISHGITLEALFVCSEKC